MRVHQEEEHGSQEGLNVLLLIHSKGGCLNVSVSACAHTSISLLLSYQETNLE